MKQEKRNGRSQACKKIQMRKNPWEVENFDEGKNFNSLSTLLVKATENKL